MRSKSGVVCIIAGLLLLLSAFGLTGYNVWDEERAGDSASKAYEQLRIAAAEPGETQLPEGLRPYYQVEPKVEMPTIEIDGHRYIGYIAFPTLEQELPVMDEWSYPNMKIAPCRYYGSAYLNDLVIAAHNYVRHFGRLGALTIGDPVRFTDVEGNVFDYTVVELEQLRPSQTREMVLGGGCDLTLFTCTIGGRQRLTVRCVRVEETSG